MKKLFVFSPVVVFVLCLSLCGCEGSGDRDDHYYNDQSYVSVVIRNDWIRDVQVFVGNVKFSQIKPGESGWVSRNLIGDEHLYITIWFCNSYGFPIIESEKYKFDREYSEYHMNIESPPNNIDVY